MGTKNNFEHHPFDLFNVIKNLFEKPLKIGMINYYYPVYDKPSDSGASLHTEYLSRNLAMLGCEVHVFTRGEKRRKIKEKIGKGKLIVHMIPSGFIVPFKNKLIEESLGYMRFENQIIDEISLEHTERKFSIIHTHGWLTSGAFLSKYFNDIKWIHTLHAVEKNRLNFMSEEEKKYYKISHWIEGTIVDADAIITVSSYVKKEACRSYPDIKNKIHVIPNGVDLNIFKPSHKIGSNVLFIGRLSKEKGVDMLYDIMTETINKNHNAKFVVLSPGDVLTPSLIQIKTGLIELSEKYPKQIKLMFNSLNKEEVAKLYKSCNIYFQPSYYEAFGMTILEAMASGKPVVITNVGGIPEVVGDVGVLVEPNANQISSAILSLLKNKNKQKRLSKKCAERAKEFSWKKIAENTLSLYQDVIKQHS